jgi:hypothetical protein
MEQYVKEYRMYYEYLDRFAGAGPCGQRHVDFQHGQLAKAHAALPLEVRAGIILPVKFRCENDPEFLLEQMNQFRLSQKQWPPISPDL